MVTPEEGPKNHVERPGEEAPTPVETGTSTAAAEASALGEAETAGVTQAPPETATLEDYLASHPGESCPVDLTLLTRIRDELRGSDRDAYERFCEFRGYLIASKSQPQAWLEGIRGKSGNIYICDGKTLRKVPIGNNSIAEFMGPDTDPEAADGALCDKRDIRELIVAALKKLGFQAQELGPMDDTIPDGWRTLRAHQAAE